MTKARNNTFLSLALLSLHFMLMGQGTPAIRECPQNERGTCVGSSEEYDEEDATYDTMVDLEAKQLAICNSMCSNVFGHCLAINGNQDPNGRCMDQNVKCSLDCADK